MRIPLLLVSEIVGQLGATSRQFGMIILGGDIGRGAQASSTVVLR